MQFLKLSSLVRETLFICNIISLQQSFDFLSQMGSHRGLGVVHRVADRNCRIPLRNSPLRFSMNMNHTNIEQGNRKVLLP